MSRLEEKYKKEIVPKLIREFSIRSKMATPKIKKVVLNMGIGDIAKNDQLRKALADDLAKITGQVPSLRVARVSIASFGLVKGNPVGLSVTLRGERMYSFIDKLFSIVLPRLRDFRGLSKKSFDKGKNYSLGISEHTIFPEIDAVKAAVPKGLEVTIVVDAKDIKESKRLLELLGMPFEKEAEVS